MRFFEHHIGDWSEATAHLTFLEDAAYSKLVRKYYATEQPLMSDPEGLKRLVGARTEAERAAVDSVLYEFFELDEEGWRNRRCDKEIEKYQAMQEKHGASSKSARERVARHRAERQKLLGILAQHGIEASARTPIAQLRRQVSEIEFETTPEKKPIEVSFAKERVLSTQALPMVYHLPPTTPHQPRTTNQEPTCPDVEVSSKNKNKPLCVGFTFQARAQAHAGAPARDCFLTTREEPKKTATDLASPVASEATTLEKPGAAKKPVGKKTGKAARAKKAIAEKPRVQNPALEPVVENTSTLAPAVQVPAAVAEGDDSLDSQIKEKNIAPDQPAAPLTSDSADADENPLPVSCSVKTPDVEPAPVATASASVEKQLLSTNDSRAAPCDGVNTAPAAVEKTASSAPKRPAVPIEAVDGATGIAGDLKAASGRSGASVDSDFISEEELAALEAGLPTFSPVETNQPDQAGLFPGDLAESAGLAESQPDENQQQATKMDAGGDLGGESIPAEALALDNGTKRRKLHRLPEDWALTPQLLLLCHEKRRELRTDRIIWEARKFKAYWHQNQGRTSRKKDWNRAFYTWIWRVGLYDPVQAAVEITYTQAEKDLIAAYDRLAQARNQQQAGRLPDIPKEDLSRQIAARFLQKHKLDDHGPIPYGITIEGLFSRAKDDKEGEAMVRAMAADEAIADYLGIPKPDFVKELEIKAQELYPNEPNKAADYLNNALAKMAGDDEPLDLYPDSDSREMRERRRKMRNYPIDEDDLLEDEGRYDTDYESPYENGREYESPYECEDFESPYDDGREYESPYAENDDFYRNYRDYTTYR